jgi:hypothetical protein
MEQREVQKWRKFDLGTVPSFEVRGDRRLDTS